MGYFFLSNRTLSGEPNFNLFFVKKMRYDLRKYYEQKESFVRAAFFDRIQINFIYYIIKTQCLRKKMTKILLKSTCKLVVRLISYQFSLALVIFNEEINKVTSVSFHSPQKYFLWTFLSVKVIEFEKKFLKLIIEIYPVETIFLFYL